MPFVQAESFEPLVMLAMRESGAAGCAVEGAGPSDGPDVPLYRYGLQEPPEPQSGLAVARIPLQVQNRGVGFITFVFRGQEVPEAASPILERLARTLESIWQSLVTPETVTQLVARIRRLQASLADLRFADQARGFLIRPEPGAGEMMASEVERVLGVGRLEGFLEQLACALDEQLGERKVISQAKNLLQRNYGLSEGEAHARLRRSSRRSRRRLGDVAQMVIEGEYDNQSA